jgi:arylsulfatase A-like enzyme
MMDDYWTHLRHGVNFMRHNREVVAPEGHATDIFTEWACAYLEERGRAGQPFFLYLAYNAPHSPIQPPPDWLERVAKREPAMDPKRQKLVALIEHMDAGVGRVLDTLKRVGLEEDTMVVFLSDNGGVLSDGANNGPWRAGKCHVYEGGLRVPCGVRWPGRIVAGSRTERIALTMDLYPTLAETAGVRPNEGIDGLSMLPSLTGHGLQASRATLERECYFLWREGGGYAGKTIDALRRGQWKVLQDSPFAPRELYDLGSDPKETTDLAKKQPAMFRDLAAALMKHIQRGGRVPWQGP